MISKRTFRLKKNGEPNYRCICRNPEKIENYEKARADKTQTWDCHHRLESCFTQKFLIDMGLYYDVEPDALIFLTRAEHRKIDTANKRLSEAKKGCERPEGAGRPPKKVICVETGEIFDSIGDAERKTGISKSHISDVCLGKRKSAGDYHWRYA